MALWLRWRPEVLEESDDHGAGVHAEAAAEAEEAGRARL